MTALPPIQSAGETTLIRDLAALMRTPRLRSIGEFAEDEIVLPTGPFAGRRFKLDRHPIARLWFAELDSGRWQRAFVTGPNQDGKSLLGFVIPTMHLLFERQETVILGVPSSDLVQDKWRADIRPVILASRYASLLPASGGGSRDGESQLFEFGNGARLRFMTAGGSDQVRAGFASPNLIVTETDGFDVVGGKSREGDKFSQLERRQLAYAERARLIAECTVSTEAGRTWQEYQRGTRSRIAIPCPHCAAYVTPEREHLTGWQDSESETAAIANARIACPACGVPWTNAERLEANRRGVLVHRGQEVATDGTVTGPLPETNTLGFRWTVVNSAIAPGRLGMVGGIEWRARLAIDEEVAERDVCQSQWALPAKPSKSEVNALDVPKIVARAVPRTGRGVCPDDTQFITAGCDVGQYRCHWTAIAWRPGATPHVIEYGVIEVTQGDGSPEMSVLAALQEWREETLAPGWGSGTAALRPAVVFVDAGWNQDTIVLFTSESGPTYFATKGYGLLQRRTGGNRRDTGSKIIAAYDGYAAVRLPTGANLIEIDADQWKTWLHARIRTPMNEPGGFTLFAAADHFSYAKHLTAETQVEEFLPDKGTVIRWQAKTRNNHWLDATMLACVAGHAAGARLLSEPAPPPVAAPSREEAGVSASDWMNRGRSKW